jgi:hypothetical protein
VRHRTPALFVVGVALLVAGAMAVTAVELVVGGSLVEKGVGVGVLLLVVVGLLLVAGEVQLGAASERLGRRLGEEGGLPTDPPGVERLPSGRLPREAADAVFANRKAEVAAAPEDWRVWFRLALAYGDARDAAAGRRAMRKAVALERTERQA